jgi:hypothetical protein
MATIRYAEIDVSSGAVAALGEAPFLPAFALYVDRYAVDITALPIPPAPGDIYSRATGRFSPPPPSPPEAQKPTLVITCLAADAPENKITSVADDYSEITIPIGAGVVASFELQIGGQVLPVDMPLLRMPITATDGRTAYAIVSIRQGRGTATWTPEQSGRWKITEANVNSELPPEAQMFFSGIDVFVYN